MIELYQGFPTIKVFGADKQKPTDFNGGRDASSIAQVPAPTCCCTLLDPIAPCGTLILHPTPEPDDFCHEAVQLTT